jgi:hypothetical protein
MHPNPLDGIGHDVYRKGRALIGERYDMCVIENFNFGGLNETQNDWSVRAAAEGSCAHAPASWEGQKTGGPQRD